MLRSVSLAVECAVELCAAICAGGSDTLVEDTFAFVQKKGLTNITLENIQEGFHDGLAARLFSDYKTDPQKINNKAMIQGLSRRLWLRHLIVSAPGGTTISEIRNVVSQKYQAEKALDPGLTPSEFYLFHILDRRIQSNTVLVETRKLYAAMADGFPRAYQTIAAVFDSLDRSPYMKDIYKLEPGPDAPIPARPALPDSVPIRPAAAPGPAAARTTAAPGSDTEHTLRNMNRLLEKEIYDLGVKLDHAKNDAIREFINALTDYGLGAPLSELYRIYKAPDTPEHIRGVINNLFMAFRSQNVRLYREREVGSSIVLSEENQAAYAPYKNEEIFLSDEVVVYYPGYRFERETMVRPTVRKKKAEVE